MKVRYTLEFPDEYRRAIRSAMGKPGLATRAECIGHLIIMLQADAEDLCGELRANEERDVTP